MLFVAGNAPVPPIRAEAIFTFATGDDMRTSSFAAWLVGLACLLVASGLALGQGTFDPRQAPACTTPAGVPSCTSPVGGGGGRSCGRPNCPHCCQPPCCPPRPGVPRDAERDQPRDAVGPPPGNYVAPPPTGTVEGPQRGVELGGLSITFPELTLGLPKLRFTHCSAFQRNGRMHLEGGVAPFVENPYAAYQMAMQQRAAEETEEGDETPRDAEENGKTTPRDATQHCTQPTRTATDQANCDRLDRLEECIRQQNEAILRCIQQIKSQQSPVTPPMPMPPPEEVPAPMPHQQVPQKVGKLYPHWSAPPPALIRPAEYLEPVIVEPRIVAPRIVEPRIVEPRTQRLPPISEVYGTTN
jgi:hypothetical protein